MFFAAGEQASPDLRASGVLIMRKFWKPADVDTTHKIHRYHCNLVPGTGFFRKYDWYLRRSGPKQSQMSVVCRRRPPVTVYP